MTMQFRGRNTSYRGSECSEDCFSAEGLAKMSKGICHAKYCHPFKAASNMLYFAAFSRLNHAKFD